MKKEKYKNIPLIILLITFLISSNFNLYIICESEDCCKTECCEETNNLPDKYLNLSLSKEDCCEYNISFNTDSHSLVPLFKNNNIISSIVSVQFHYISIKPEPEYSSQKYPAIYSPVNNTFNILRI